MKPVLHYGLGFRPQHYRQVTDGVSTVADFFEVISENFMTAGGRPRRIISQLKDRYPVVTHGVGLSIAGPDPLNPEYLDALRSYCQWLQPEMVSDHLCWTGRSAHCAHDLLPFPLTSYMLQHVASRIQHVQDLIDQRLYLENPSAYVGFAEDEMDEATFLSELVKATGCGIILDINNLYVNSRNLGYDSSGYLNTLSADSIGYMHLAGHTVHPDVRIDTHDGPVAEEVWALYRIAVSKMPGVATLIEWDDKIPEFSELNAELVKAKHIRDDIISYSASIGGKRSPCLEESEPVPLSTHIKTELARDQMLEMVFQVQNIDQDDQRLKIFRNHHHVPAVRGINVYNDAYFFRIRDIIRDEFFTLYTMIEPHTFNLMVTSYLREYPPSHYDIKKIPAELPSFLRATTLQYSDLFSNPLLADIAALELARFVLYDAGDGLQDFGIEDLQGISDEAWEDIIFQFQAYVCLLETQYDLSEIWDAVANQQPIPMPKYDRSFYLIYRFEENVYHERLTPGEIAVAYALNSSSSFDTVCSAYQNAMETSHEDSVHNTIAIIVKWTSLNLIYPNYARV